MKKLLVICGSTATGKTSLALILAKKFNGELISADSKQLYRRMDIGTGKDIPKNFEFRISNLEFKRTKIGYYTNGSTCLWGYDLVDPKEEFSVAHYVKIANKVVKNIWKRKKLPIIVGGTGLYMKGLIDGIETSQVPKNENLRESLENKSVSDLQNMLKKVDPKKLKRMNKSDRNNPRRLIRAIEVAKCNKYTEGVSMIRIIDTDKIDILFIGLSAPGDFLNERIEKRVEDRLSAGLEKEIENLLKSGVGWDSQAMQSLGYRQWGEYFEKYTDSGCENGNTEGTKEKSEDTEKEITEGTREPKVTERKKAIENWTRAERQYAKRQMTWFKKDKRINWFDISKKGWKKEVENTVFRWHNNN